MKDAVLTENANRVREERKALGLEGLTGGLEFVIISVEQNRLDTTAADFLCSTGFRPRESFEDEFGRSIVLAEKGSADIVLRVRKGGPNPFATINLHPKSRALPNTRLETFVFKAHDLVRYVEIQKKRGIKFMSDNVFQTDRYKFIQTAPSPFTGNSIGLVEWNRDMRQHAHSGCKEIALKNGASSRPYLSNIRHIDHIATRAQAADRDPAILEFMRLTDYNFQIAIYIEELNSITNVARLSPSDFALVFTSGIAPYSGEALSGPTEKFVHNYGARVHHMAFHTERIEETYESLARDGMRYLIGLVGSREEGLKQTFTVPSANTMIVNEYIYRYGDFDGFFTRNNVKKLTAASDYTPND